MEELLKIYAQVYGVDFIGRLGEGKDGEVFQTDRQTAVKFLHDFEYFNREERAYRVLADLDIRQIDDFYCPHFKFR